MIESINTSFYTVFTVILYLYITLFVVINNIRSAEELYNSIKTGLKETIYKNPSLKLFSDAIFKNLITPLKSLFIKMLVYIKISCEGLDDFVGSIDKKLHLLLSESVDYTSLAIRKIYTGNERTFIVYSTGAIVVFYFILTIF